MDHTNYLKCQDFAFDGNALDEPGDQITGIRVTAYGRESGGAITFPLTPTEAWHFKMVDYDGVQHGQVNGDSTTLFTPSGDTPPTYTSRSYPASATNYMWNSGANQVSWYENDTSPGSLPTDEEIVNDPDFGVAIWLNYYAYTATVEIDGVEIEVFYNEDGDPNQPRIAHGRSTHRTMGHRS